MVENSREVETYQYSLIEDSLKGNLRDLQMIENSRKVETKTLLKETFETYK